MSLWREKRREKHTRRFYIFRTLMATRGVPAIREHVDALNLVEVDFHGVKSVQDAHRTYLTHLRTAPGPGPKWGADRLDLLAKLLRALSEEMNMPMGEIDIRNGGYAPDAWLTRENIDQWTLKLAKGEVSLPVTIVGVPPVPPPPPPAPAPANPSRPGFFSQKT